MPCIPMQIKSIKACQGKGWGTLPLREWLCHPFSSTGLGSLCECVLSQPQRLRYCRPVPTSIIRQLYCINAADINSPAIIIFVHIGLLEKFIKHSFDELN